MHSLWSAGGRRAAASPHIEKHSPQRFRHAQGAFSCSAISWKRLSRPVPWVPSGGPATSGFMGVSAP